jgi:flagellar motor switch protein FliN/FliY
MPADAQDRTHGLAGEFADALAQVIESMTEQRPEVKWESQGEGPPQAGEETPGEETLWWAQGFQILPLAAVWVGTPRAVWAELGTRTLRAAGLESVEPADARSTWMEILGQALAALARATGSLLGQEVTCSQGGESPPPADAAPWARVQLGGEGGLPPIWLGLASALAERLRTSAPAPAEPAPEPRAAVGSPTAAPPPYGRTMDLLLDVELPISISFGRTHIPLKDVLKLTTGSIVELNRGISEPVEVLVNHSLIARGEVVVIDGNYGVKIQQIASTEDRLRSLR